MVTFRVLEADADAARFAEEVLCWIYEAGKPYFPWFFGDEERARSELAKLSRRPSSEVFVGRATLLLAEDRHLGGFLCLDGHELEHCRMADAVEIFRVASKRSWPELKARIGASRELFPPVTVDDFYLSKMGILPECRRRGLGRQLVSEYLARGRERGFKRFRLDVWNGNDAAINLYSSFGFEVEQECRSDSAGMTYLAMVLAER